MKDNKTSREMRNVTTIFLTPAELSQRYGNKISVKTLANWRSIPSAGPEFARFGGKIFYPLDKVLEWERNNTYGSTSQYRA